MHPLLAAAIPLTLGSFLLFSIQMIIGKALLPSFGGSPALWSAAMVFFQAALLVGYLAADVLCRGPLRKLRRPVFLLALVLVVPFVAIVPSHFSPEEIALHPIRSALLLLARHAGAPFLLLAAFSPLIQFCFARSASKRSPYGLYALSNAASLLGLLSYPLLLEPLLDVDTQARLWEGLFIVFAVCAAYALFVFRPIEDAVVRPNNAAAESETGGSMQWILWLLLPFVSSALLLAVTAHIGQDVAAVPLLWMIPLALYLITLVIQFSGWALPPWTTFPVALLLMLGLGDSHFSGKDANILLAILFSSTAFFVCCLTLHGDLYRLRPNPQQLTRYYLLISLGSAVGSLFVGVAAPLVFDEVLELPLSLTAFVLLSGGLFLSRALPGGKSPRIKNTVGIIMSAIAIVVVWCKPRPGDGKIVAQSRSFYGVLRVIDQEGSNGSDPLRTLYYGTVVHGAQILIDAKRRLAGAYYGADSAVGRYFAERDSANPLRVGVVGLGVGMIAAYLNSGDSGRFYEINPDVLATARDHFTFLQDSPAMIDVVLGDARLSLESEAPQNFDLLFLDAFSGDAIPAHLLSIEAFELYRRHLAARGTLIVHCSNLHLSVGSVVLTAADRLGWPASYVRTFGERGGAEFVVLSNDPSIAELFRKAEVNRPALLAAPWSDRFSDLIGVMRF